MSFRGADTGRYLIWRPISDNEPSMIEVFLLVLGKGQNLSLSAMLRDLDSVQHYLVLVLSNVAFGDHSNCSLKPGIILGCHVECCLICQIIRATCHTSGTTISVFNKAARNDDLHDNTVLWHHVRGHHVPDAIFFCSGQSFRQRLEHSRNVQDAEVGSVGSRYLYLQDVAREVPIADSGCSFFGGCRSLDVHEFFGLIDREYHVIHSSLVVERKDRPSL